MIKASDIPQMYGARSVISRTEIVVSMQMDSFRDEGGVPEPLPENDADMKSGKARAYELHDAQEYLDSAKHMYERVLDGGGVTFAGVVRKCHLALCRAYSLPLDYYAASSACDAIDDALDRVSDGAGGTMAKWEWEEISAAVR